MQIGIIGLSYSGKTTLFQTLSQIHIDASATGKREVNQSIVKVPDNRLDILTNMFNPKKKINATIEFVDITSVQSGETKGQLNSQFMVKVRANDALIHTVRAFENDVMPHPNGSIDIMRDIAAIEDELLINDLAFVENRLEKLDKDLMKQKNKDEAQKEIEVMKRWSEALENNIPLRELDFPDDEQKYLKNYQPLTAKPLLIAINMSEDDVSKSEQIINEIKTKIKGNKINVEPFFAKIELELSQLNDEEKQIFMDEYGLKDSPLDRMIRSAYDLLGLQSFFTVGEDETRAWTIKKGMTAQEAAGTIHTDFYNKFIRAEVVAYNDFIEQGSFVKCKEKGLFRLEGKEYIVNDGDILNIRHG